MQESGSGNRLVVLDGLRGAAAVMIMLYHGSGWFPVGAAAVDFFFVLSGFVLARRYAEDLTRPGAGAVFARARIIRLYPVFFIGMLLGAIVSAWAWIAGVEGWNAGVYFASLGLSLLMLPYPLPTPLLLYPLNPPAWSLLFELFANAVMVPVARSRWLRIGLVVVSAPLLLLAIRAYDDGGGWAFENVLGGIPRVLFSFFVGVLLHEAVAAGRLPTLRLPAIVPLLVLALAYQFGPGDSGLYFAALVFILHPLVIWMGAGSPARGWLGRLLSWLGAVSYGLYLVHLPVQQAALLFWQAATGTDDPYLPSLGLPITSVVALGLAHVLTFHVEPPARRLLRRLWPAPAARVPAGT